MRYRACRLADHPILDGRTPGLEGEDGANVNGPSLLRVPAWIARPLGRYYLYFAHHHGRYIRLAVADAVAGPWRVVPGGVLPLASTPAHDHVASPDVHVDEAERRIRLYFHGCTAAGRLEQVSFVATAPDGLQFTARREPLGPFYFRVFRHDGWHYALAKRGNDGGQLLRSRDGFAPFEPGPLVLPRMRHAAVALAAGRLEIVYSCLGDAPERLLYVEMALAGDWRDWRPEPAVELLRPERAWEGADEPVGASRPGRAFAREHALRDPALFDDAGRRFLVYAAAGEQALGLAELHPA